MSFSCPNFHFHSASVKAITPSHGAAQRCVKFAVQRPAYVLAPESQPHRRCLAFTCPSCLTKAPAHRQNLCHQTLTLLLGRGTLLSKKGIQASTVSASKFCLERPTSGSHLRSKSANVLGGQHRILSRPYAALICVY